MEKEELIDEAMKALVEKLKDENERLKLRVKGLERMNRMETFRIRKLEKLVPKEERYRIVKEMQDKFI